jgi:excisionase family DNA binding protein
LTDIFCGSYKVKFMGLISTSEAAKRLGVHITRVQVLIRAGRLPAQKIGGTYVVDEDDLKLVADRKPGRPPKAKAEPASKAGKKKGRSK